MLYRPVPHILMYFVLLLLACTAADAKAMPEQYKMERNPGEGLHLRHFDSTAIQDYHNQRQFRYEDAPFYNKSAWELLMNKVFNWLSDFLGNKTRRNVLIYTILVLVVVFVLLQVLQVRPASLFVKNKSNPMWHSKNTNGESPADLMMKKHHAAIVAKDYRNALRYLFILVLLRMEAKGILHFEPHKTAHEYLQEVKDQSARQRLKRLTRHFEYVWYGHFPISEHTYMQLEQAFIDELKYNADGKLG